MEFFSVDNKEKSVLFLDNMGVFKVSYWNKVFEFILLTLSLVIVPFRKFSQYLSFIKVYNRYDLL